MRGQFHISWGDKKFILPNRIFDEGELSFLKMIVQADVVDVSAGGNFFIGLCGDNDDDAKTLVTLSGEPGVVNGYARKAVARNSTGWPTVAAAGKMFRALSAQVTFTASGGSFDTAIKRAFLCNVGSGTSGLLFALSGRLSGQPITVPVGTPLNVQYELFMR